MTLVRILVVLSGFLMAGIALVPLSVVVNRLPLPGEQMAMGAVSGSVWRGRIDDVSWDGEPLGDFRLRTQAWPLLAGRLRVDFTSSGPLSSGQVSARASDLMLLNLNGQMPLARLAPAAPTEAMLSVANAGLDLDGLRCKRAGGQATVTGLASLGLGDLSGPLTCDAGRVVLTLTPTGGGPSISIVIDAAAEGGARLSARSRDAVMQASIAALGLATEEEPQP